MEKDKICSCCQHEADTKQVAELTEACRVYRIIQNITNAGCDAEGKQDRIGRGKDGKKTGHCDDKSPCNEGFFVADFVHEPGAGHKADGVCKDVGGAHPAKVAGRDEVFHADVRQG